MSSEIDCVRTCRHSLDRGVTAEHPKRIVRFRIERVLGKGGFGQVYLAHDEQLDRFVAGTSTVRGRRWYWFENLRSPKTAGGITPLRSPATKRPWQNSVGFASNTGSMTAALFDMHGNLWEWTQAQTADPSSLVVEREKVSVLGGGSFLCLASALPSASRCTNLPFAGAFDYGFRVVRTLPPIPPQFLP